VLHAEKPLGSEARAVPLTKFFCFFLVQNQLNRVHGPCIHRLLLTTRRNSLLMEHQLDNIRSTIRQPSLKGLSTAPPTA